MAVACGGGGGGAAPKNSRVPSGENVSVAWSLRTKPARKPEVLAETASAAFGSEVFQR